MELELGYWTDLHWVLQMVTNFVRKERKNDTVR